MLDFNRAASGRVALNRPLDYSRLAQLVDAFDLKRKNFGELVRLSIAFFEAFKLRARKRLPTAETFRFLIMLAFEKFQQASMSFYLFSRSKTTFRISIRLLL